MTKGGWLLTFPPFAIPDFYGFTLGYGGSYVTWLDNNKSTIQVITLRLHQINDSFG